MNERIKELWNQSKASEVHAKFGEYDKYSVEHFAELIIHECRKAVILNGQFTPHYEGRIDAVEDINKHFGMK